MNVIAGDPGVEELVAIDCPEVETERAGRGRA